MAGSYYVETLTNDLIERAAAIIGEVDAMGGSIAAIESGWMQARIAESAYRAQQAIERGEQVVVGVNRFAEESGDAPIPLQRVDERVEREQVERLRALRAIARRANRRAASGRRARGGRGRREPHAVLRRRRRRRRDARRDLQRAARVFGTYRSKEVVA